MASAVSAIPAAVNPKDDQEALGNIAEADLIFYRNVEIQTGLIQNYRNAILGMATLAASHAPKSGAKEVVKSPAPAAVASGKKAQQELEALAKSTPNEYESAQQNLVNVVDATKMLMHNCVSAIQALDELAISLLGQAAIYILD